MVRLYHRVGDACVSSVWGVVVLVRTSRFCCVTTIMALMPFMRGRRHTSVHDTSLRAKASLLSSFLRRRQPRLSCWVVPTARGEAEGAQGS